jgi:hypothetical protein
MDRVEGAWLPVEQVRDHFHLGFGGSNLLRRRGLRAPETEETRHNEVKWNDMKLTGRVDGGRE